MAAYDLVEVTLWGETLGAIIPLTRKPGFYEFEYAEAFVAAGLQPSPLHLPVHARRRYSFPSLNQETYQGLPGVFADSLPDRFGNALIDEYLARRGLQSTAFTTLQRLLYVGRRAVGALEYEPPFDDAGTPAVVMPLELAGLVEDARRALRGNTTQVTQQIIDVGSSAGGARAKAVIGWNPTSHVILSGQFDLPPGFEHWILKFDVGEDRQLAETRGYGRIEYAHYLMAKAAGVEMSDSRLLEENGRAHFMTRRFDRSHNEKIHMHSLCGIAHLDFNLPSVYSYEQCFRTVLDLDLGAAALEQAWLRCAFNVAIVNCDDHTKNIAFLMHRDGTWQLAPAFDVAFAHTPLPDRWTRQHQMLLNGKAWGITAADLLGVASEFAINRPKILLQRVIDTVGRWPEFADEAGVPDEQQRRIGALQRASLSLLRSTVSRKAGRRSRQ